MSDPAQTARLQSLLDNPPPGRGKLVALIGVAAAAILVPMVARWEGKSNDPYRDIAGIYTVCYGETRVAMRRYSDAQCETMLSDGLGDFAKPVLRRNPELRYRPNQLAASVSLAYNIGDSAYARSSVARHFSAGQWRQGCDAFLSWNRAGGHVVNGLRLRREAERQICLKGLT